MTCPKCGAEMRHLDLLPDEVGFERFQCSKCGFIDEKFPSEKETVKPKEDVKVAVPSKAMAFCAFCGANCDNLDYNHPVAPDALCDSCRKISPKKWCDKCLELVFGDKWLDKVKEALLNMDDVILAPVCPNCRTNKHVKPVRDTSQCFKCGYIWQFIIQERLAVEYPHDALIAAKNLCYQPENLKKGNSWKNIGMSYLFSKLQSKFQELIQASIDEDFQKTTPDSVAELCLHVINYLAFIYKRKKP